MPEEIDRLRFDDLQLYLAAFEVRYGASYLIWDKAGAIWSEVLRFVPELKMRQAEPNRTVFESDGGALGKEIQLTVQPSSLNISAILPEKKLGRFTEIAEHLSNTSSKYLQVSEYTRVGLRVSFNRDFETPEDAAATVLSTARISAAEHPQFGVNAKTIAMEYSIRREDGKNGFVLWLKAQTLQFESEPPFGLGPYLKPLHEKRNRASIEVDSFLMAPVSVSQIRIADWIAQTYHIIKRDISRFLEG